MTQVTASDGAWAPPGPTPIEDYAVLGDSRSVAVVSRHGSIDWLCLPWLDSDACFAALLGTPENGRWLLTADPDAGEAEVRRRYLGDSFVLETTYTTPTGRARVVEAMPLTEGRSDIIRRVEGLEGQVVFVHEWVVRFGYGRTRPWVHRDVDPDGRAIIRAIAGPDALTLHGDRLPAGAEGRHRDRFAVGPGDHVDLVLTWNHSWEPVPGAPDVSTELVRTMRLWARWCRTSTFEGEFDERVVRSLLALRVLTQHPTGGIAAAATTSLPEEAGGERNWDYRFCWLRDAAQTLEALLELGFRREADTWRSWLLRAVAGDPENLQIMYRLDGSRDLPERELPHLAGYGGARPVRTGNGAVAQHQNDVLGEVMLALDLARRVGLPASDDGWALQRHLVDNLLDRWRSPDHGIWEVRGPLRHFTHSKVMCWAALDCAIRAVEDYGCDGPVKDWRVARAEIHADVLAHGWDPGLGSFVQYYGARHTDAALLQMVQVGFLPPDDPRLLGTIARVRAELADGPWVRRYRAGTGVDGVRGDEHPFLACCFWLVGALARTGDVVTATNHMRALCAAMNDVGLLAEEYDPVRRRYMGNYPQAFSHLALARAAHALRAARASVEPVGPHAPVGAAGEPTTY
ncbi:glycoside hydrolase family 15 protein [Georgenia ruanii]|uniref:Glycoside hydrolase family 15 protein n=1 Tax=Georgenia ruanii TaxID=348442 RepID=A0A7J9V0G1_9MICO|nr:glycoside hydrolase family 15 protein [Georgenia ruanii]MPV90093.1 glycoside hydrolase family 15 protein [Georgenia ruanii]